jgi:hypothetical protein
VDERIDVTRETPVSGGCQGRHDRTTLVDDERAARVEGATRRNPPRRRRSSADRDEILLLRRLRMREGIEECARVGMAWPLQDVFART